jgi:hypothetical protein
MNMAICLRCTLVSKQSAAQLPQLGWVCPEVSERRVNVTHYSRRVLTILLDWSVDATKILSRLESAMVLADLAKRSVRSRQACFPE